MNSEDKKTLLLVEDEALIALAKQMELEKYGYNVLTVNTGEKAVVISKKNHGIDLILMDIDLGQGMDGTETAEVILMDRGIPVVFLSSHMEPEIVEKTEKITSYGYVVKSSSITVLDASIKMAFKLFQANKQIEESEKKQRAMMSDISDVIGIIGIDGILKYKSPNIEKWFGWLPEELVGTDGFQNIHPDDNERIQKDFANLSEEDNSTITIEFKYKCKDGSYKPVELTAMNLINDPIINGVLLNYRDITERKQAEQIILESEIQFRMLFDNAISGIAIHEIVMNESGIPIDYIFLKVNKAFETYTGLLKANVLGRRVTEVIPGIEKTPFIKIYGEVVKTGKSVIFEQFAEPLGRHYSISAYRVAPGQFATAFTDITERIRDKELLEASEKRYRELYENSPFGYHSLDTAGRFIEVNPVLCSLLDYKHDELIGKWFGNFLTPKSLETFRANFSKFKEKGKIHAVPFNIVAKDGHIIPIELDGSISYDKEGHFKQTHCVIQDVTTSRQKETESQKNLYYLTKTQEIGKIGTWELDIQPNNLIWTDEIYKIFSVPLGTKIDNKFSLNCVHPDDRDYVYEKWNSTLNNEPYEIEYRIIANDKIKWVREKAEIDIDTEGNPTAVIGFAQDITERKQAEATLVESRERVNLALKGAESGMWDYNISQGTLIFDERSVELLGSYPKNDKELDLLIHPDDIKSYDEVWDALEKDREYFYTFEYRLRDQSGQYRWLMDRGKIVEWDSNKKPIRATGTIQDITKRKETEAELLESEKRFRDIAESMADWIWEVDIEGRFTFCSERVESILGYSPNEIIGKTAFDLMCPEEKEPVGAVFGECVLAKKPIKDLENWNLTKDGRRVCLLTSGIPILDEDGNCTGYRGVNSDITENKQKEVALRESEEHFRLLAENARDMIYRMSLTDGKYEYVSPASIDIFGYSPDEFYNSPFLIKKIFHPDWIDYFEKQLKLSLEGIVAETYEYQIIHKSGETRWINQRNFLICDKNGKPIAIEGVVTDVSESKKAEEEIKHQLSEKEIILKETHHRIKNNFATIVSLLNLQCNSVTNPEIQSALQDAIGRVNSMQVLYEKLLLTDDYRETSIKQYLMNLIDEIMQIFPGNAEIKIESQIDDFQLDPKRMVPIGIIINELLTNTMKYAFSGKTSGSIEVTLKEDNGDVTLSIQDNGNGLPDGFDIDTQKGFGLMLVKMLCQQLGGSFNIENQNGTRCTLKFCV